jgi:hypothetical protein
VATGLSNAAATVAGPGAEVGPVQTSRKASASTAGEKGHEPPGSSARPEQLVDIDEPPKASEIKDAEEDAEPTGVWGKRLDELEKHQVRIEKLLEQIAAKL